MVYDKVDRLSLSHLVQIQTWNSGIHRDLTHWYHMDTRARACAEQRNIQQEWNDAERLNRLETR